MNKIDIKRTSESLKRKMVYLMNQDIDDDSKAEMISTLERCHELLFSVKDDAIIFKAFSYVGVQACLYYLE